MYLNSVYVRSFVIKTFMYHYNIGDDDANLTAKINYLLASSNNSQLPEAIMQTHPIINTHIKFELLIQYFNQYKIFTDDEMDHFNSAISKMEKVNKLILYLRQKDYEGNCNFVRALSNSKEHSGHRAILKELYKAVCKNTVS